MIQIAENISVGDFVYAWFSPFNEKNKKHDESEYKVTELSDGHLKLESPEGGWWMVFGKELLETWNGNVRKASK